MSAPKYVLKPSIGQSIEPHQTDNTWFARKSATSILRAMESSWLL